ncbi:MAG: hypothetical protein Q8M94_18000 [Ignavibacteria bacterium]|nr:hypothetical protein [Ignavibacteria bacterium]
MFKKLILVALVVSLLAIPIATGCSKSEQIAPATPTDKTDTSSPPTTVSPEKQKDAIPEFTTQELSDLWVTYITTPEKKRSQTEYAQLKDKRIRVSGFIIFIASTDETKLREMLLAPAKEDINKLREGVLLYSSWDSSAIYAWLQGDKFFKKTEAWKAGDAVIIEGIVKDIAETPHKVVQRNLGTQTSPKVAYVMLVMTIEKAEKIP